MRVAFLLPDLSLSGGAGIVVQHARQLQRNHGMEVVLGLTRPRGVPAWPYPGLDELRVATLEELAGEHFDLAVATWWETAMDVFDVEADRHAYFLQLLEDSQYPPESPERIGFVLTLGLPVRFLTAARWITDLVEGLQPGNPAFYAKSGMDKEIFASPSSVPPASDGPLRVVIEGSLQLPRKGVPHALEAVRLVREDVHVTLVTPEPPSGDAPPGVDVWTGALPHREMASLFLSSHVLLKLSRAEGMYGPPLEAFHMACTCVTNPINGSEEYVRHGENALVVDWDDPVGTARALDLLARDRALLQRLRSGALETARAWPDWEEASNVFAENVRQIVADPPPAPAASGVRMGAAINGVIGYGDALVIRERVLNEGIEELRGVLKQRAIRTAFFVRRYATPVLAPAKAALRRSASRSSTNR